MIKAPFYRYRVSVAVAPAATALTVDDLKAQLAITDTSEDSYLGFICQAAVDLVERYTGRRLITQTLHMWADRNYSTSPWWDGVRVGAYSHEIGTAGDRLPLIGCPVQSVSSVKSYSSSGVESTMSASDYQLSADDDDMPAEIVLDDDAIWPTDMRERRSILVEYIAGYGADGSAVPPGLMMAVRRVAAHLYANRGDCAGDCVSKCGAAEMLGPYRIRKL